MIYGIIVAMESELTMLLNEMEEVEQTTINGLKFCTGRIASSTVTVTQSGIGKVNAAVATLTLIDNFRPDAVINTGIAGGTGKGARILDVVVGDQVGYYDVWCGPGNLPGQVQGLPVTFDGATRLLKEQPAAAGKQSPRVVHGLIASGDMFISTEDDLQRVLSVRPEAVAVDMESGAIAQVCYLRDIPFLAIRVVSDTPGTEDQLQQYADFWSLAPKTTFSVLRDLLV